MKQTATLLLFLLAAGFQLAAQVIPGRFIVEMEGEPAAVYAARRGHRAHSSDRVYQGRRAEIQAQHQRARPALEQHGAVILAATQGVLNSITVLSAESRAAEIAAIPGVIRVHPVRLYKPMLDHALPLHHVPDAWNQIGGMGNAGLGMKIAIIDTGVDVRHPAFQDSSLTMPVGFPIVNQDSDKAYTSSKIIVARSYGGTPTTSVTAKDEEGHGTGVAMTAAGGTVTGTYGTIIGVAPKAFIGSYKVFPNKDGAPTDLIIQAIEDAVTDGMDVLNLSLGSVVAQRPQDDPLVSAVEAATAAGKLVVVAAGNAGPDPNTIGSPGTAPDAISVGSMFNDRLFSGTLKVGDGSPVQAIPGSGPNSTSPINANVTDIATLDPSGLACNSLPSGSLSGSIALVLRGTCTFETKINNVAAAGAVAALIYATPSSPDPISMAAGNATLPASMVSNRVGASIKQQVASGGVSATLDFQLKPIAIDPSKLSSYSSLGPNSDSAVKPDLIAVGDNISTAQPMKNDGSANDGFVVESGTSFSSPMVAGAAALLKAARPGLTAAQYRSLLINSSTLFDTPLSIQRTGAGFLNMQSALNANLVASPTSVSFGTAANAVSQTFTIWLTNLGTATDTYSVSTVSMTGSASPTASVTSITIDPGQSGPVDLNFKANTLDTGAYQGYVQIQGTQSAVATRIPYWFGVGPGTPAHITILDSPTSGTANSRQTIYFRITDDQGLAAGGPSSVTFTAGGGSVVRVNSIDQDIPGAYQALIRLGAKGVSDVIHIDAGGGLTKDVTIPVQ